MRSVDTSLAEIQQRTAQAVETLLPVFGFGGTVVDVMAKLDIGIEAAERRQVSTSKARSLRSIRGCRRRQQVSAL
jgi:hypothetical protein